MKRKIIISIGVIALVVVAVAAIPFLFKDKLLAKVKTTLNNQVNAKVNYSKFNLSVFSQFPMVEVELQELTMLGINAFANDTLFSANSVSTKISLMELIRGDIPELKFLYIDRPRINLVVDSSGAANWDIVKAPETVTPSSISAETTSEESFKMNLKDIRVKTLNLSYDDRQMPMKVMLKNTDLQSTAKVDGTLTSFDMEGNVGEFMLEYDSVKYISKTTLQAETLLKVDYEKMNFGFDRGKIMINKLPLEVNGSFAMPSDSMLFDLYFRSEKSDFATILALVPADYQKYLEKADIKGDADFKGSVKGLYYNDIYPAINVFLAVSNASFKYQDLPESVQDIQVSAQITKPEGIMNLLKVNVDKAHASIKNNPLDLSLNLREMMTDPDIAARFSGIIDFNTLKQAIPIDSLDITGIMNAKMQIAGRLSSIENKEYEKFKSDGQASIRNFRIKSNQLTQAVEISQGRIKASNKQITIDQFEAKIGQSDFSLRGDVSNYLSYFLKNGVLNGNFNLKSTFMNFSELSNIMKPTATRLAVNNDNPSAQSAPKDSLVAFQVPDKLDLTFQSNIQKAIYDRMPVSNINGLIRIKEQKMELSNLSMYMLQGKVTMNGSYQSNKENNPVFDFKMNMESLDLPNAYQSLTTFQRYVPIASHSQGKFSSQFGISGKMNEKMNLIATSLNGQGIFNTFGLTIIESPIFDQIRGIIKKEKLKNVKIEDFTAKFQFENGALKLNPFKTTIADQQTTIYGSLSASREINLTLDFLVNREDLGTDLNKGLAILPGSENIKMIDASVILKGPITKPEVSLDLSKARAQIEQEVKKASVEQIKGSVKKLGDELKKLFK